METLRKTIPSYRSPSRYSAGPQGNNWHRQWSPAGYRDVSQYRQFFSDIGQNKDLHPDRMWVHERSLGRGGDNRGPANQAGQPPGPPPQQMSHRPNNQGPSYPSPMPNIQGPTYTQS